MKKIKSLLMKVFPFYRRRVRKTALKGLAKAGGDFIREKMKQTKGGKVTDYECPRCGGEVYYYWGFNRRVPIKVQCDKCEWFQNGSVLFMDRLIQAQRIIADINNRGKKC